MFSKFAKFASFLNLENCSAKSVIPLNVPQKMTHLEVMHIHVLLNETFELEIRSKFFFFIEIANNPIRNFNFTFPSGCWSCLWSIFINDYVMIVLQNECAT